jgi:hypothetical protein
MLDEILPARRWNESMRALSPAAHHPLARKPDDRKSRVARTPHPDFEQEKQ